MNEENQMCFSWHPRRPRECPLHARWRPLTAPACYQPYLSTDHQPNGFSSTARMQAGVRVICFPLLSPFDARSPPAELVDTGEAEASSNGPQRNAENSEWRMRTAALLRLFRYERGIKDTRMSLRLWDRGVTPYNSLPLWEGTARLHLSLNLNLKYYPSQGLCPLVLNVSRGLDQSELHHQLGVRQLLRCTRSLLTDKVGG